MSTAIRKASRIPAKSHLLLFASKPSQLADSGLTKAELDYVADQAKKDVKQLVINQLSRLVIVQLVEPKDTAPHLVAEQCRKAGQAALATLKGAKATSVCVCELAGESAWALAGAEGMALGNYQFLKYFKDKKKKQSTLTTVQVYSKGLANRAVELLETSVEATCIARTLVNEPLSFLTAVQLSKEAQKLGKLAGFKTEVLNKKKIETLKMGGVLAVNRGSIDPPTFTVMEWKPKGAKNKQPVVLVGKGIVYDTGGLSLKPTPNSMDFMKSDMGGSAAVIGTMYAVAKAELPVHVVALVPATDNRPGGNAYAPGDVITMYNGSTVEVLNTDAEGRLVLADALTYAQQYKPELVIDLATLTGAAAYCIGDRGIVSMGTADQAIHNDLKTSGDNVFERLAEMPFWDDYSDDLKSTIADLKNLGGSSAGHITAGKFLQHFTLDKKGKEAYPWMHFDIAGPAWNQAPKDYRGQGGTGAGVRVLFDFLNRKSQ